ncbi:MAG: indolepyruvate ferredoxin oxidoreductase family protein, partial [Pseudomonadota bacterium]
KVGMVWPLENDAALSFVKDKREVLVVEEKRGIIESWLKESFYDYPGHKPERMVGKTDETGERLIPWTGELAPQQLAPIVAARLDAALPGLNLTERANALANRDGGSIQIQGANRMPYFCSGCPHNTSTKVPEGSQALAGIGCHFMASWMDRDTESLIQMGGEGVNWVSKSLFNGKRHIFQNLGEGTYYHSGSMAIRQAIAAGTNITYKILYNDAVAMTGGQPVDGPVSVPAIAQEVRAEGVQRIALVSDSPEKFSLSELPSGVSLHHRREMDAVQRELRDIKGVTVLIYEQPCATETRRRRKRGLVPEPDVHVVINDLVCEGCGDCSVESNCLSVVPLETPFGRKRQIDQNSCNKDLSCVNGFCPSFVTVTGATRRKPDARAIDISSEMASLQEPTLPALSEPYDLLVTGVGGTGVITVGAVITMAAHLEGKGASVLDFMGFAQKFGPVLSYIRLAESPDALHQVRIGPGQADALIGCDLVVSSSPKASGTFAADKTRAVLNTAEMATADFVLHRDANLKADERFSAIEKAVKELYGVAANKVADVCLGDSIYANVLLTGMAWQQGLIPISLAAMQEALRLNGVKVENNLQAFAWGRLAAARPDFVRSQMQSPTPEPSMETLDSVIARRAEFLTGYQNTALAGRYEALVRQVEAAEREANASSSFDLTRAVVRSYFKLLAYKDEYEVARLHSDPAFKKKLNDQFEGDFKLNYHLAPPALPAKLDARGRPYKRQFGAWLTPFLGILARGKRLRGSAFDLFGLQADRKMERALIVEFEQTVQRWLGKIGNVSDAELLELAQAPMEIRGYGPVKEKAVIEYRERVASMLDAMNA